MMKILRKTSTLILIAAFTLVAFLPVEVHGEEVPISPELGEVLSTLINYAGDVEIQNVTFTWQLKPTDFVNNRTDWVNGTIHFDYLRVICKVDGGSIGEEGDLFIDYRAVAKGVIISCPIVKLSFASYAINNQLTFHFSKLNNTLTVKTFIPVYQLLANGMGVGS